MKQGRKQRNKVENNKTNKTEQNIIKQVENNEIG